MPHNDTACTPRGAGATIECYSQHPFYPHLGHSSLFREGHCVSPVAALAQPCRLIETRRAASRYGEDPSCFVFPRGLAVRAQAREVVVADRGNDRLQVFTLSGEYLRQLGGHGTSPGRLLGPYDVKFIALNYGVPSCRDLDGHLVRKSAGLGQTPELLIVSEYEGRRVQVWTVEGAPLQVIHGGHPTGLADCGSRVLVADFASNTLRCYRLARHTVPTAQEVPVEPLPDEETAALSAALQKITTSAA